MICRRKDSSLRFTSKFGPRKKMTEAIRRQQMRSGTFVRERAASYSSSSFNVIDNTLSNATMLAREIMRADAATCQLQNVCTSPTY